MRSTECQVIVAVCFQTSLAPFGLALFAGDAIMTDRSFTLFHCLNVYKYEGVIQFVDDHISRRLDVRLLLPPSGTALCRIPCNDTKSM